MQKSLVKALFTALIDAKDSIYHEYVPEKHTVNGKFCREVCKKVHRVRPEFQEIWSWNFLHDSETAHSSGVVSEFLTKRGIPLLSHPPPLISAG
jgi:hypothetical protein